MFLGTFRWYRADDGLYIARAAQFASWEKNRKGGERASRYLTSGWHPGLRFR